MGYKIKHKKKGWVACTTWSKERAEKWLKNFDPKKYIDKTLKASDFEIVKE